MVDCEVDLQATGYAESIEAMFREFDRNVDGVVTAKEYVDPIPAGDLVRTAPQSPVSGGSNGASASDVRP